jgi:hypothetical protein
MNARLQNHLNGPVKSMTFETFEIDSIKNGDIIVGNRTKGINFEPRITDYSTGNYSLAFTLNGDIKEIIVLGTRGQQVNKYIAFYNKKNQLKASESIDYSENKTTYGERFYKENKIEAISKDDKNKILTKMTLLYDESQRLKSTETVDSDNNLSAKTKYIYEGDVQIAQFYDKNEKLNREVVTNSKGNTIKEISCQEMYYKYDSKDILESIMVKNNMSKNIHYDYLNDENGNAISSKKWNDNILVESFRFEYDYDKNKNWTKRVMFENDKPIIICLREIEYY